MKKLFSLARAIQSVFCVCISIFALCGAAAGYAGSSADEFPLRGFVLLCALFAVIIFGLIGYFFVCVQKITITPERVTVSLLGRFVKTLSVDSIADIETRYSKRRKTATVIFSKVPIVDMLKLSLKGRKEYFKSQIRFEFKSKEIAVIKEWINKPVREVDFQMSEEAP